MVRQRKNKRRKKHASKSETGSQHSIHLLRCVLSVLLATAVIGGVTLLAGKPSTYLIERDPNINARYANLMKQARPKVVLLGNSMLGEGVDERLFMNQTGQRTLKLWSGGWSSAVWYLALKNVIVPASPRPQTVVVFFRDHFLTDPTFRVTGDYKKGIDQLTGPDEPLLERLAYLNAMNPLTYWLNQNWSLFQKREDLKHKLESDVKSFVGSVYRQEDIDTMNRNINQTFGVKNLLADQLGKAQLKSEAVSTKNLYDLKKSLPVSFLPAMIQIARESNVRLVLVRVKRRREAEGLPTPAGLDDYIHDLKQWCDIEQVPLIDFSGDNRLTLEHYADGDHLNREDGRALFTQLLAEQLKPYLTVASGATR